MRAAIHCTLPVAETVSLLITCSQNTASFWGPHADSHASIIHDFPHFCSNNALFLSGVVSEDARLERFSFDDNATKFRVRHCGGGSENDLFCLPMVQGVSDLHG